MEHKQYIGFVVRRFKERDENVKKTFEQWLKNMLEAKIITEKENEVIHISLKSPEVYQSIRTWIVVFWFSVFYVRLNSFAVTPLVAIVGWALGSTLFAYVIMYIIKRFIINAIVGIIGKDLPFRRYVANMSMIPILGEHVTMIELYRLHGLAAQYFFAFFKTKKAMKRYLSAKGADKEKLRIEWKRRVDKNAKWLKEKSDWLLHFETTLARFFMAIWGYIKSIAEIYTGKQKQ